MRVGLAGGVSLGAAGDSKCAAICAATLPCHEGKGEKLKHAPEHMHAPGFLSPAPVFFTSTAASSKQHADAAAWVTVLLQVLGMGVSVSKALAGCLVASGVVGLLAIVRVLSIILGIVPDSIKLAVVSNWGSSHKPTRLLV